MLAPITVVFALCGALLAPRLVSGSQPPKYPPFYSATFVEPSPPSLNAEFRANYMQHKFDIERNHIVAGFAYFSPSNGKMRLDAAYDGVLASSIFDFTNVTVNGNVANTIYSFNGGLTEGTCASYFVAPALPLFAPDILNTTEAVYFGVQHDDMYGSVDAWQLLYSGTLPTTVYLDSSGILVRIDFTSPGEPLRTFTTTRFFNIIPGLVNSTAFATPCR